MNKFHAGLAARFPEKQERVSWKQGFQNSEAGEADGLRISRSVDGYRFVSQATGKIVQVRCGGFTFNKLRPYSDWSTFGAEARELWERYVTLVKPVSVHKFSLRYLNRIELPLPLRDFRDYCLLFPEIPAVLPQGISDFFLRVTLPVADHPTCSVVTLSFEPPAHGTTVLNMIFDNEAAHVFGSFDLDTEAIWSKLETLGALKNGVFMASLTERAKALFR